MNIEKHLKKDYITNIVLDGKRVDGRAMDEFRRIELLKDYVESKAEGSALVKLGDTQVLAGVSFDAGEPYSDSPDSGVLTTSVELRPLADPNFETGPPREDSIELARVVDRGIRESGAIDFEKLKIDDENVWVVYLDIHVLDNDGNLFDAANMASVTALYNAKIPKFEDGIVVREPDRDLNLTCLPLSVTASKIAGRVLFDPNLDEEYATDARLTVATSDTINAMQKGGDGSFTEAEIESIIDMAFEKAADIRKLVEG
ncbi:MAG: exosome complex protein Rrp42 [Candidatus Altiarchaeota archaeon]